MSTRIYTTYFLLYVIFFPYTYSATLTWDGGGIGSNWSEGGNWAGDVSPSNGDSLVFSGLEVSRNSNDSLADVESILFDAGAGAFSISGNQLDLTSGITNNSVSLQSLDLDLVLLSNQEFNAGSGSIVVSGDISGSGVDLTKSGQGILTLNGSNTFSGDLSVDGGTVVVSDGNSSGIVDIFVGDSTSGTMQVNSGATISVSNNWVVGRGGDGVLTVSGTGTMISSTEELRIGDGSGNSGEVYLLDNAQANIGDDVKIADSNADGLFVVKGGSDVTLNKFYGGYNGTGKATVLLDGDGTTMRANSTGVSMYLGWESGTQFFVTNGADLTANVDVTIARDKLEDGSGDGIMIVSGSGSTVTVGDDIDVGRYFGTGVLSIRDSGEVMIMDDLNINQEMNATNSKVDLEGGILTVSGEIEIYANGALNGYGTISQDIINNGTMDIDGTMSYSKEISGSGSLYKSDSGTLTLTGSNTFSGGTYINGGALRIGGSEVLRDDGVVSIGTGGSIEFSADEEEVIGDLSIASGIASIDLSGNNHLLFDDDSSFSGILLIDNWEDGNDRFGFQNSDGDGLSVGASSRIKFLRYGGGIDLKTGVTIADVAGNVEIRPESNVFSIWDGGGGGDEWDNNGGENWVGDALPVSGESLNVELTGSLRTSPVLTSSVELNTLIFGEGAESFSVQDSGSEEKFIFTGTLPTLVQDSSKSQIVEAKIDMGSNTGYENGDWIIAGKGSGDLVFKEVIDDPLGSYGISKYGDFTLKLGGDNTYEGATRIYGGKVSISSDGNLGKAPLSSVSDHLILDGGDLKTVGTFTLSSNRGISVNSNGSIDVSSGALSYDGVLKGEGTLTKLGAGSLSLGGESLNVGDVSVREGVLFLNGSIDGSLKIEGGSVYGGTDSNAVAGNFEMSSGSLMPGSTAGSIGKFNVRGGGISYLSSGSYVWEVSGGMGDSALDLDGNGVNEAQGTAGVNWDLLEFSGVLNFAGASEGSIALDITSVGGATGFQATGENVFLEMKIIEASNGIIGFDESYFQLDTGDFSQMILGNVNSWGLFSDGQSIWLRYSSYQPVPEPSTYVFVLFLVSFIGIRVWRRKVRIKSECD